MTDKSKAIEPLSAEDRCRRAFATQARAAVEVERLTPEEVAAFAELIDVDGEPLHLAAGGKAIRHCDRKQHTITEKVNQRFSKLFTGYLKRLHREASEKQATLARQRQKRKGSTGKRRKKKTTDSGDA